MTDLKNMSVDELLQLHHEDDNFACGTESHVKEVAKELARRLREQERRISWLDEHSIMPGDWQTIVDLAICAEHAGADLEQMTAKCAEMSLREANILLHFSPEHLDKVSGSDCGTKLAESLSNLPASVEKLLAISRTVDRLLEWDKKYPDETVYPKGTWNVIEDELADIINTLRAYQEKP